MKRSASAVWKGGLKEGSGKFGTQSGVLKDVNYSYKTRFENEPGTNPEELIAAAHASCFSMALGAQLEKRGIIPESISTTSTITLESGTLTKSELETTIHVPGAERAIMDKVEEAVKAAEEGCPISKVLKLEISVDSILEMGLNLP